jgi:hypothetical protein
MVLQHHVSLHLRFSNAVKQDADNVRRARHRPNPGKTQDALCEGLGLNDNRVVDIHLIKHIDPLHPHLYVELEAISTWQFDKEYRLLT